MSKAIGLDFGSSCTVFCTEETGEIKMIPSVVAIEKKSQQLMAVGADAKKMIGRTHSSIQLIRPIKEGLVNDVGGASTILNDVIEDLGASSVFRKAVLYVSVPVGLSSSEEKAFETAILEAGINTIEYVDAPIAIALGAGMPPDISTGRLIVDVGAGHTNASVVSHGRLVTSSTVKTAGDAMTAAIAEYVACEHGIEVGELTAELIKIKLGTLNPNAPKKSLKISGKVRADKCPKHASMLTATDTLTSEELIPVLSPLADKIVDNIKTALEKTPAELSSDIFDFGILLSGGGAALDGMTAYIRDALGIKVTSTKNPAQDAARGLLRIIKGGKPFAKFTH